MKRPALLLLSTLAPLAVLAAPAAEPARQFAAPEAVSSAPSGSVTGLGQVTLSLAIVLGAIFLVAWLARRMRTFGRRPGSLLDVIADVPLGAKERAVLIRVGEKQILVGVAAGAVTPLYVLETPLVLPTANDSGTPNRPDFRALLMKSLGKS